MASLGVEKATSSKKVDKKAKKSGEKNKVKKVKKTTVTVSETADADASPTSDSTVDSAGLLPKVKSKKTISAKDGKEAKGAKVGQKEKKSAPAGALVGQAKTVTAADESESSKKMALSAFLKQYRKEAAAAKGASFEPVPLAQISDVSEKSKEALQKEKAITSLFEIQARVFEHMVAGKDVVGKAKTGCGKTLAFCLPLVERFAALLKKAGSSSNADVEATDFEKSYKRRKPLAITLAPTRELAKQIIRDFEILGKAHGFSSECLYGGVQFGPQCQVLREGRQIIVATPGRLLDHIQRQTIDLSEVRALILDEADEMLSMGFQEDVDAVINALPRGKEVQKLLFSATLPSWVNDLVKSKMHAPAWVDVSSKEGENGATNKNISHKCIFCPPQFKADTLGDFVKVHAGALFGKTIIFCDSKKEVNDLAQHEKLTQLGAGVLHGDVPQNQREVVMENFRTGKIKVLVATDVAARGLDVPCVDLVINTRPPQDVESYVHRSGRTGRAGNSGVSIVFYSRSDEYMIRILQRKLGIAMKRAKALIEERGAEQALAAAMAGLTGYTKRVQGRSLLSSFLDCTCLMLTSNRPIEAPTKGFFLLRQFFDKSLTEDKIKGMTVCKDGYSVIFDVPSDQVDAMLAIANTPGKLWDGVSLTQPRELPEVQERGANDWAADDQAHRDRKKHMWERRTGKGDGGSGKGGKGGGGKGGGKSGAGKGGFVGRGGSSAGKGAGWRAAPY
eukprot:g702.t1